MRKITLATMALFISFSASAASNLGAELTKRLDKQTVTTPNQNSTIVYGGKDLSRSIVASAHESTWTREQPVLIG